MQSGGRYCPNCGNSLSPGARFCPNCGQDQSPNATIIGDAEAISSVPPDSNNMSMTQQTVPPQAGQGQQSKGRGGFRLRRAPACGYCRREWHNQPH
jgi:predicted amidophosphoribosyltransferase